MSILIILNCYIDYNENVILLAPEFKAMEIYMLNLIITCIMLCHEEFGNCIYKGEKVSHCSKTKILTKMYRNFTKTDQEKLNNTLDKYNLYLQNRSRDVVNNGNNQCTIYSIKSRAKTEPV